MVGFRGKFLSELFDRAIFGKENVSFFVFTEVAEHSFLSSNIFFLQVVELTIDDLAALNVPSL